MYKLDDQTKADLATAWGKTTPILKKIAGIVLRATALITFGVIGVVLLVYSFLLGLLWIGLGAAAGVFYLNYRDTVAERMYEEDWKARQEARKQKMGW